VAERAGGRRRLAVVSLHAHRPLAPRGERTRRVVEALEADWEVELIAPAPTVATGGAAGSGRSNPARRLAARTVGIALLDKWEPWSARRLRSWKPRFDGALLIGHPYSPLVYASRRLRGAGVPYVVDVGDPWVLTSHATDLRGLAHLRATRAERALWRGAAGGVLTTPGQAAGIEGVAPGIRTLIRPNGYDAVAAVPAPPPRRDDAVLRLAHFGMFNSVRLDPRPLLQRLAASGRWSRIVLSQFGDDFAGFLDHPPAGVQIERNPAYPWEQVVERAVEYDLALVVGNVNPKQLPSKAVQYLTLPIPRLALSCGGEDALAVYVADKPGWLTVHPDEEDAPGRIAEQLARRWSAAELAPPASESWPAVAASIAGFVGSCVEGGRAS
jgi:hypothetical protein